MISLLLELDFLYFLHALLGTFSFTHNFLHTLWNNKYNRKMEDDVRWR